MERSQCLVWIFITLRVIHCSNTTLLDRDASYDFQIDVTSMLTSQIVRQDWNKSTIVTPKEQNISWTSNVSHPETATPGYDILMQIEYYNDMAIRIWRIWSPVLLGNILFNLIQSLYL